MKKGLRRQINHLSALAANIQLQTQLASSLQGSMLDVGCGRGEALQRFLQTGRWQAIGLDIDLRFLKIAKQQGCPVIRADASHIPFKSKCFNLVLASYLLHHVKDIPDLLLEIHRVLKEEGTLMLAECIDDNLLFKYARYLSSSWQGHTVESRFRYIDLRRFLNKKFKVLYENSYCSLSWIFVNLKSFFPFLERSKFFKRSYDWLLTFERRQAPKYNVYYLATFEPIKQR